MLLEKSEEITPERMKRQSQTKNTPNQKQSTVVEVTGMEARSDAVKSNIA